MNEGMKEEYWKEGEIVCEINFVGIFIIAVLIIVHCFLTGQYDIDIVSLCLFSIFGVAMELFIKHYIWCDKDLCGEKD